MAYAASAPTATPVCAGASHVRSPCRYRLVSMASANPSGVALCFRISVMSTIMGAAPGNGRGDPHTTLRRPPAPQLPCMATVEPYESAMTDHLG